MSILINKFKKIIISIYLIVISCNSENLYEHPNVIIILADDLGWSQLGCYGSSFYDTPNIDKLALRGIKFNNAYSSASICSPTRAAIMTGKYPARLGLTDFIPGNSPKNKPLLTPDNWIKYLPLEQVTIAEKMKSQGYMTGFFGKWHLSREKQPPKSLMHNPNKQGFTESFVTYKPSKNLIQKWQNENEDFHNVDTITKRTLGFLSQHHKSPFFLFVSHNSIHDPLIENHKTIEKYKIKDGEDKEENNAIIAAMIETLDKSVGQIIKRLEELKLIENTILIFYSDNGGKHAYASQKPFRKGKGWLYEGGIRVPLIISWPKKIKKAFNSNLMTSSIDLMPTILNACNFDLKNKNELDGIDISQIFNDQTININREELFWHYPHYHSGSGMKPASAIRWKNYKLIEWHESTLLKKENQIELYNLDIDPGEENNLAKIKPSIALEMRTKLNQWIKQIGAKMPTTNN